MIRVKVYNGYGHTDNLVVYGHVLRNKARVRNRYTDRVVANIVHLLRLFFVEPVPGVNLRLRWNDQVISSCTEKDGFFKFEWKSNQQVAAGFHQVSIDALDKNQQVVASGTGQIIIAHVTQLAFISDIDDTVLVSHSATIGKRLRVLFTKNPRSRKAFRDVVKHYSLLALSGTTPDMPNPFFYVSSSEWNLYDDLVDFFAYNKLPDGSFLLNQMKKWYQLIKTGKTKHEGKLIRVVRILDAFPKQRFVFLGDNSQKDPEIYVTIAKKYPSRVHAIYIRNIRPERADATIQFFKELEGKSVYTCLFADNLQAIEHSKSIGLIS